MITQLETPCREWMGQRYVRPGSEYGQIWRAPKTWYVHRWVWTLANGPIPDGMCVMHLCDNPPCFRLDHLRLGTHAENMADMKAKGRARCPGSEKTHCPQGHPYAGENLRLTANGGRKCRICQSEGARRSALRSKEG